VTIKYDYFMVTPLQCLGTTVEPSEQPAAAGEPEDINPTCPFAQKLYAMLDDDGG
jgi:hypothetical protein